MLSTTLQGQVENKFYTWTSHLYDHVDNGYSKLETVSTLSKSLYTVQQIALKVVNFIEMDLRITLTVLSAIPSLIGYVIRNLIALMTQNSEWTEKPTWFKSNIRAVVGSALELIETNRLLQVWNDNQYLVPDDIEM